MTDAIATTAFLDAVEWLIPNKDQRNMTRVNISAHAGKAAAMGLVAKKTFQKLEPFGIAEEFSRQPDDIFVQVVQEMLSARELGKTPEALQLKPVEYCSQPLRQLLSPASLHNPPATSVSSSLAVLVIVARFREDVSWVQQLPEHVGYHIVQKDAISPDLPCESQSLAPNVGRESHSYLSQLRRLLAQHRSGAAALPPLVVCAQANPFDHNSEFLDDLGTLASLALAGTPPLWTPLGLWTGGERLICCDASGAPHQSKLLPIANV